MIKLTTLSLTVAALAGTTFAQPAKAPAAPPAPVAPPPVAAKPPEAPPEIIEAAKGMNGTWKCVGKADVRGTMMDIKATITHKLDANLNKFWIESNFVGNAGKMPPMKFKMMTTYDAASKKLWRVSVGSMGGHSTGWGTMADKKVTFEMDATGPMGSHKLRHSEEFISPKEVKVSGETSKDNGKTWVADHEATCKK